MLCLLKWVSESAVGVLWWNRISSVTHTRTQTVWHYQIFCATCASQITDRSFVLKYWGGGGALEGSLEERALEGACHERALARSGYRRALARSGHWRALARSGADCHSRQRKLKHVTLTTFMMFFFSHRRVSEVLIFIFCPDVLIKHTITWIHIL